MRKIIIGVLAVFILSFLYGCTQEKLEIPANFDPCAYIDSMTNEAQKEKWCLAREECKMYLNECIPKEVPENRLDSACEKINTIPNRDARKQRCDWWGPKFGCYWVEETGECVPVNMPENSNWYYCEKINRLPDGEKKQFMCEWHGRKLGCKWENGECVHEGPPQNVDENILCGHINSVLIPHDPDGRIHKSICESHEFCKWENNKCVAK